MTDRPRFLDDIAGLAGNAFSAVTGAREELHAIIRTRVDEALSALEVVRREEFDAVQEMAARARIGQEEAEKRLDEIVARLDALETGTALKTTIQPKNAPDATDHAE